MHAPRAARRNLRKSEAADPSLYSFDARLAADPPALSPIITQNPRLSPARPPVASTSRLTADDTTPPRDDRQTTLAAIHAAETPVQMRNVALRTGTASAKRTSSVPGSHGGGRGSINRASRMGEQEAVPHPSVPTDKLYRSTSADDPIAERIRAVVSWTAQRQRDKLFPAPSSASSSAAETLAKRVINSFIADLPKREVDCSVPHLPGSDARKRKGELPEHPQNVVNAAKMEELRVNYASIDEEQQAREDVSAKYIAVANASSTPGLASFDSSAIVVEPEELRTVNLPTSYEEAVELGKLLVKGELVEKKKGKAKESEVDEVRQKLADVRIQSSHFRLLATRQAAFSQLASTYISSRVSQAHQALSIDAQQGLSSRNNATGEENENGGGIAGVLDGTLVGSEAERQNATGAGGDSRDLLRAIASADSRSRGGV
ncbi:Mtw1 kinetochore complex, DSN1 [Pseudohyphozyma bogoriensis]|nr:Mtw1 kinetochore complex, DSN1 [Pseudohyphozyma bogoriensis]